MSTKYLLPCSSCGKSLEVRVSQAGEVLRCSCGSELDVPTMRGIQQLQPARQTATPARRTRDWSAAQGGLFAFGLLLLTTGSGLMGYYQINRSRLDTTEKKWDNLDESLEAIDSLDVDQTWDMWMEAKKNGLGPQSPPPFVILRRVSKYWYRYVVVGLSIAGFGLLLVISAFLLPRRKHRPHPRTTGKISKT